MNKIFVAILSLLTISAHTQVITYQQAVTAALQNNLQIQVARYDTAIAHNNNTAGNAGMLPNVAFNAGGTWALNNTNQDYQTGLEINRSGVRSNNLNAGIALNWTIFDGMGMFAAKSRLNILDEQSRYRLKTQIEDVLVQVTTAYFEVVRQQQQINAITENIKIFEEQLRVAETRLEIGKSPKTDVLQAKVDLNAQRALLLQAQNTLLNAQTQLNQLLNQPVETVFEVEDDIVFDYSPGYEDLKGSFVKKNNSLMVTQKEYDLSQQVKKEIAAMRYPRLNLVAAYNFTRASNQASLILLNQNYGPNFGFTLSWNLFDGGRVHQQVKNANLNIMSQKLVVDDTKRKIELELLTAWRKFDTAKKVLAIEEENYTLAKENVDISLERFKLGNMTSIEFSTIQQSLQESQNRLVNARYEAKVAETNLKRINGDLVK